MAAAGAAAPQQPSGWMQDIVKHVPSGDRCAPVPGGGRTWPRTDGGGEGRCAAAAAADLGEGPVPRFKINFLIEIIIIK